MSYTRLPISPPALTTTEAFDYDDNVDEGLSPPSPRRSRLAGISEAAAWRVLLYTAAAALVLSAFNLSVLSSASTLGFARTTPSLRTLKRPSVYLGLENVVFDPPYCRSRGIFPKTFYTYDVRKGRAAPLERVHAPDDKMTMSFGGPVSAFAVFRSAS